MKPVKDSLKKINSVAFYCHNKPEKAKEETVFIRDVMRFLYKKGIKNIYGDVRTLTLLKNTIPLVDDEKSYGLKIGIGGDGTLLKMIRTLHQNDGLILGINFGTLGFLSELCPENALLPLNQIFSGDFFVDDRLMIKAFIYRKNKSGKREKVFQVRALNEIVFGHGGFSRLSSFNVRCGRRFLSTYRSDRLIFATPTGSTAYSMSAGGPILLPSLDCISIVPVSPHSLTHRPIVLPSSLQIGLDFEARVDNIHMTIDGQVHFSLRPTDEVVIQQSSRKAHFIRFKESHYFKTLRNKLGWGERH